jgi:preprotein translocase subunit SecA
MLMMNDQRKVIYEQRAEIMDSEAVDWKRAHKKSDKDTDNFHGRRP